MGDPSTISDSGSGAGNVSDLCGELRTQLGTAVSFDEPLAPYTSFKIGGPADIFVLAHEEAVLSRALKILSRWGVPILVLGGGTNLLVSDTGLRGAAIKLGTGFSHLRWERKEKGRTDLRAGGAARLSLLAAEAARRSLSGLEFAEGIPGTLGGALLMNAGAFGGEVGSLVAEVEGVTLAGRRLSMAGGDLDFSYRRLELSSPLVITAARLQLKHRPAGAVQQLLLENRARRKAGQPLRLPNAGSIFKNPPGKAAGKLIEEAGLKGARAGAAQVSPQHANFIVNLGGATARDVASLIEQVRSRVAERFGVSLEPEVKMVGQW